MSPPFISVIITSYNRKEFLKFAVESALKQSLDRSKYELIVSKDFHDGELDEIIERNNITTLFFEGNSIGRRMAHALESARGEVIAFLDDDDIWSQDKLSHVFHIFSSDSSVVFYHNAQFFIDDDGKELPGLAGWDPNAGMLKAGELNLLPSQLNKCDMLRLLHLYLAFNASSIVVRKKILNRNISVLSEIDSSPDDFLLFAALAFGERLVADNEKLTGYRVHKRNVSSGMLDGDRYTPYEGNYRSRQFIAYKRMEEIVGTDVHEPVRFAFHYSMNYLKLTALLTTARGNRRDMISASLHQTAYSLYYAVSSPRHSALAGSKFGLWYNIRLSILSILFLASPSFARSLYSFLYVEMKWT